MRTFTRTCQQYASGLFFSEQRELALLPLYLFVFPIHYASSLLHMFQQSRGDNEV